MRKSVVNTASNDNRYRVGNRYGDKRQFSRSADKVHALNTQGPGRVMRGGIRL